MIGLILLFVAWLGLILALELLYRFLSWAASYEIELPGLERGLERLCRDRRRARR